MAGDVLTEMSALFVSAPQPGKLPSAYPGDQDQEGPMTDTATVDPVEPGAAQREETAADNAGDSATAAVGWRVFALSGDEPGMLRSPMGHQHGWGAAADYPAATFDARCDQPHDPPDPGCYCGVYAVLDRGELLAAFGDASDLGAVARVELTGRIEPGTRIPLDDPVTTVRGAAGRLMELFVRADRAAHVPALVRRYRVPVHLVRAWSETARFTADGGQPRVWETHAPQATRPTRLQRRGVTVDVNAAGLLVVTRILCAYWHPGDARVTPRATALMWARAWNQARDAVVTRGFPGVMAADGWRDPASVAWVTRTLPVDLLAEVEMGRRADLGDGALACGVDAYWLDMAIVLSHGLGFVLGGYDPPMAVTAAASEFAGRVYLDKPTFDRPTIRAAVNEIHQSTDNVASWSARPEKP